jgi:hypothetical protein
MKLQNTDIPEFSIFHLNLVYHLRIYIIINHKILKIRLLYINLISLYLVNKRIFL